MSFRSGEWAGMTRSWSGESVQQHGALLCWGTWSDLKAASSLPDDPERGSIHSQASVQPSGNKDRAGNEATAKLLCFSSLNKIWFRWSAHQRLIR